MDKKIIGYIELLRPFTLLAPIIVSGFIMVASLIYTNNFDISFVSMILTIIPACLCFALLNGASNALNQATDFKEDVLSKPYRPIPKGIISKKEAIRISLLLYIFTILLSFTVNIIFSFFILFIAFFSVTYSLPPRMKKFLFINQLWVAIPRGFLGILASWSVFANPFDSLPLSIAFISALFLFGGTSTKDILDSNADKKIGTRTLVNVFGLKNASLISFLFMSCAFILIIPLIMLNIIESYLLPLSFLIIFSYLIYWLMIYHNKNEKCENTSAWTLMYATYMLYIMVFCSLIFFYCA